MAVAIRTYQTVLHGQHVTVKVYEPARSQHAVWTMPRYSAAPGVDPTMNEDPYVYDPKPKFKYSASEPTKASDWEHFDPWDEIAYDDDMEVWP